jgi:hypothetical protein
MTSRHSSYFYFLSSNSGFFLYYLGFHVMAILCCAAKNSLRGTATIFSKERNSKLVSLPLNGLEQNSKCLLLFCSMERNSELCSLPRNGSERNSESFCAANFLSFAQLAKRKVLAVVNPRLISSTSTATHCVELECCYYIQALLNCLL